MAGVDNENLTDAGLWRQRIYMRNGLPLFESGETGAAGFREAFPQTVAAVEELLQRESSMDTTSACLSNCIGQAGCQMFGSVVCMSYASTANLCRVRFWCIFSIGAGGKDLPKGSVEFSILDEGTHIKPHCGPSNHKWRFHLGVIVPDNGIDSPCHESAPKITVVSIAIVCDIFQCVVSCCYLGSTSIRVGNPFADGARRPWEEGKVLLFDDSYEHEVFHDGIGKGPRVVLIVDV
jgi:hypothetical protein